MATYSSYKMNEDSIGNPRDASFSSYLDEKERDFVQNLPESIYSLSPTRDSSSPRLSIRRRNRIPHSELGVFGAERYFNEKIANTNNSKKKSTMIHKEGASTLNNKQRHRREKRDHHFERKSSKSTTTSTITSSLKSPNPCLTSQVSWNNSQFGLFLPKKASSSIRIFSSFQCKGSCFSKKSVYTISTHQRVQQSPRSLNRTPRVSQNEHFAFPVIDTASPLYNIDQPRESIDVFGNHQVGKQEIEHNLERKLSILAWDAIPNSSPPIVHLRFSLSKSKKAFPTNDDDMDVRSECSSDLFEIENLVGVGKEGSISQISDTNSTCMTPMTHFDAPSEASIEWSVVTGSATGLSMISDDIDGENFAIRKKTIAKNNSSSNSGLLLGCRNYKAIDVRNDNYLVDNVHRRSNNEMILGSNKFDVNGSPNIAPSTPSRRSIVVGTNTMKNYAIAYA